MRIALSLLTLVSVMPSHLGSGDDVQPRDTVSVIESVVPALPAGVRVSIVGGDSFLRVESDGVPVEVHGYDDEQYLRFDANGTVQVNVNSTTSILNGDRYGRVTTPNVTEPNDVVKWRTIATNGVAMWHDHRIHWMSPAAPRAVDEKGTVQQWAVPFIVDGTRVLVSGTLYVRDRASWMWWLFTPLAAAAVLLLARSRRLRFVLVPVIGVFGTAVGWMQYVGLPSGARVTPLLFGFCVGACGLGLAAWFVRRNSHLAVSLNAGAGAALVTVAWMSLAQVRAAYVPGVDPAWMARATVAAILGTGLAATIDGVVRVVRDTTQV